MLNGSKQTGLQDIEKPIQIEASKKALKHENCQVFPENWLDPPQHGRIYPHHQVGRRTYYYSRICR